MQVNREKLLKTLKKNKLFYSGRSMKGTFRQGDYLRIAEVGIEDLKRGDVVVYKEQTDDKKNIVHRIISIKRDRIITRGDYNLLADKNTLNPAHLVGKVVGVEKSGVNKKVLNGVLGYLKSLLIRILVCSEIIIKLILRPFYRALKKSAFVPKIWKPDIKKIFIKTLDGEIIKYIHGSHTVAQMWPKKKKFLCKKPYDLIIKPDNKIG